MIKTNIDPALLQYETKAKLVLGLEFSCTYCALVLSVLNYYRPFVASRYCSLSFQISGN